MSRRRLPTFYLQVAGGLLATLFAVGAAATALDVDPSLVVTASIVMLLAGIGFMGAIQDALTGFPLTAGARMLEALLATAGIIAGVSGGLTVADVLGVNLGRLDPGRRRCRRRAGDRGRAAPPCGGRVRVRLLRPAASLLPIALIAGGRRRCLAVVSEHRLRPRLGRRGRRRARSVWWPTPSPAGSGCHRCRRGLRDRAAAARPLDLPRAVAAGGGRLRAPREGIVAMMTAASVAVALASGVILGEYLAQPLKRETRRLEVALSGPRLVGPFRATRRGETRADRIT